MRTMSRNVIGAVAGVALLAAYGCNGSEDLTRVRAAEDPLARGVALSDASQPADGQVLVTCEPTQRTLVRQVVLNGRSVARVECVTDSAMAGTYGAYRAPYGQPTVIPAGQIYEPAAAPVYREAAPRVVRQPSRVITERRPARSVKKSAIIIGSSAGVGAGVGAAVGGKKGALIGAAIGGGSAAIWDQITRR
jgi:hypothetical protein